VTHTTIVKVGQNRSMPRVYLAGKWLARAGFEPDNHYDIHVDNGELVLEVAPKGKRKVSVRKGDGRSIIDLNTPLIDEVFAGAETLRVVAHNRTLRITQTYINLLIRSRQLVDRAGSLFTGGGFLDLAAKLAGFTPVFGVELNESYSDIYGRNNPDADVFNASVEQVSFDEMRAYRPLGLLTMGIPCDPFSNARRLDRGGQQKRDMSLPPEAHELGDMTVWALRAFEAGNPHSGVIEEVPGYLNSASWYVLERFLKRLGYTVEARLIDPAEYGELTGRKRAVIVATTGQPVQWPEPKPVTRRLADILEPGEHAWFDPQTKPWVYDHWQKQTAKGNGFEPPKLTGAETRIGTIKRRYFAGQGDNPVVQHPHKCDTHRWLTVTEVKRLHGVPDEYDLSGPKTVAGEVLGQGVLVEFFRKVIKTATGK
jgi:DNA (cytosine-5)-methyltransferase 1